MITETEIQVEVENTAIKENHLVLYNDDVNTFDYVIELLMKVCNHDAIQAEQCAMLVHYKGKCSVKRGSFEVLEPMLAILSDAGLTVEIN
ncbi:MAG: ATP-dependent Clp protease adaptor ClpS [Flavobacteriales bacterium]|nr:MAG: Clp protease ClpS [Flavobacteriales bacterium BRH_c54]MCW8898566.1 ATP-dependent Clp protease adaptor ClpS [Flavobacteriales bacterium]MCW8912219.1 ATP-dependent Clp protease adaptor ClpS [Flavobacteriales bacterium]MCW8938716.1 ATP-dependent Clp protease adaptor ClpS [Flavobacteriales bacterium]MCW8941225.1 ATP-dependent Clp protease adaptor ClpS [Flavobacteriales bacterium]